MRSRVKRVFVVTAALAAALAAKPHEAAALDPCPPDWFYCDSGCNALDCHGPCPVYVSCEYLGASCSGSTPWAVYCSA